LKRSEFLRKVRRLAKRKGLDVKLATRGKGSHSTLYVGGRKATLPDPKKELKSGTLRAMCEQLGIDPRELT
jgi:mRNA interferase HicA